MSERTDWAWCYENPKEAASLIDSLEAERDALRADAERFRWAVLEEDNACDVEFAVINWKGDGDAIRNEVDACMVRTGAIAAKEPK